MKNLRLPFFILTMLFFMSVSTNFTFASDANRDGVFIHISSGKENPHKVVMALKMATLMSAHKDVLVYLDIKGIQAALKNSKDITYPQFPSAHESIKTLLSKGIKIYACPGCLKVAKKKITDLLPGVELADKDAFFSFTKGRILTLDY